MTQTETHFTEAVLDALVEGDFLPTDQTDEQEPSWAMDRYDAWRIEGDRVGLVNFTADELTYSQTTPNGVIFASVTFGTNDDALALFSQMVRRSS